MADDAKNPLAKNEDFAEMTNPVNPEAPPPAYDDAWSDNVNMSPVPSSFVTGMNQPQQQPTFLASHAPTRPFMMQQAVMPLPMVMQQPAANVNITLRGAASLVLLGPRPVTIACPACHALVTTDTRTHYKCITHCCCVFLTLILCWPCLCIPYCMDGNKEVTHTCPNCKSHLGIWNKKD